MRITGLTRAAMLAAAVLVLGAGPAMAAGGPPPGVGGGGGEVETLGNNLSTPTIFVPSVAGAPALRTTCPTALVAATGPTALYDGIAYYLQKTEAVWSAECSEAATATVTAKWGDNLLSGMAIKAGKPIRVEMTLLAGTTGSGFDVLKLTDELDRYADYGTTGVVNTAMATRVWDAGAHLTIVDTGTGLANYDGPITAEINSTGSVVFGYNWGVKGISLPQPGTYLLTFSTSPATAISAYADGAAIQDLGDDGSSTSILVVVSAKSGGGGRK